MEGAHVAVPEGLVPEMGTVTVMLTFTTSPLHLKRCSKCSVCLHPFSPRSILMILSIVIPGLHMGKLRHEG